MATGATDRAPPLYFLPGGEWTRPRCTARATRRPPRVQAHYTAGTSGGGGGNQPPAAVAGRLADERDGAPDGRLLRAAGSERPGRDDRLLRLGPGRGRRVRRLLGRRRRPLTLDTAAGSYSGAPAAATDNGRAHPTTPTRSRSRRPREAAAAEPTVPRSSRTPRLPTGAWARPRGQLLPMPAATTARGRTWRRRP